MNSKELIDVKKDSTKEESKKENPPETVYKARDIIDGKFLEDYFYNS
jgi:hypothetical protein